MALFIVTRPAGDAAALIARLQIMGHEAVAAPLLDIRPFPDVVIPDIAYQAVLFTSANGVRALARHRDFSRIKSAAAIAVGKASAAAARDVGFAQITVADGDVAGLIAEVKARLRPDGGPLLYASGRQITGDVEGTLAIAGFTVHRAALYEALAALKLPDAVNEAVEGGKVNGVLLYSPRTARIWCRLALGAGLADQLARLAHFCLSANVEKALSESGCGEVQAYVAERPEEGALLRLIAQLYG